MWFKIKINDMKIASKFVNYMKDLTYETILHSGKYSVDAKSILGVFSLDLDNVLTLEVVVRQGEVLSQDVIDKINQFACKGE